jgi:hypothetical protein
LSCIEALEAREKDIETMQAEWAELWDLIAELGGWDDQLQNIGFEIKELINGDFTDTNRG